MSESKIAPMRPSVAKFLKRQLAGFYREYDREVNGSSESETPPAPKSGQTKPAAQPDNPPAPKDAE